MHGIDLTLKRGEFVALIGPSGSGKSTLLNIIGLLDRATSGQLFLTGVDTQGLNDQDQNSQSQDSQGLSDQAITQLRANAIGFIFQFHNLLPAFSAVENVMLPLIAANGHANDEMRQRALDLVDKVELAPWGAYLTSDLSGGQQQRIAIARSLIMNPALVLADEPTGNLDTKSADNIFNLMRDVSQTNGTTFLIVTHDPRLAKRCDRIIELVDGRIDSDKPNIATSSDNM